MATDHDYNDPTMLNGATDFGNRFAEHNDRRANPRYPNQTTKQNAPPTDHFSDLVDNQDHVNG